MVCPECHTPKPWTAPRCHNCNQHIGIIAGLIWNLIAGLMALAMFFGFFWVLSLFFS
jgi:hypothetical protein